MVAGSPVPFKVPLYRRLHAAEDIELHVFYASNLGVRPMGPESSGYGDTIRWDSDLLAGYRCAFLRRADRNNGYGVRFTQLIDPDVVPMLARERYHVVWLEGYSSITHLLALATQRTQRLGIVLREEQTLLNPRSLARTLTKEVLLRALFAQLDAAAYISRENRRWLEHYGVPPERLFSSPYAPDTDHFTAEADRLLPQREALRAGFGFPAERGPIIMTASRLVGTKQPGMVIEAFRRLRRRRPCGLLVVGSGPEEARLKAIVEGGRIPDVRFAGFLNQSQISRAYAAADVFTLLSARGETFGMAVAEAMHFALPLVLSDKVGSGPDLLSEGSNGFLVEHDDIDGAAVALERLVADAQLRRSFGAASRARIASRTLDRATEGAVAAIRFAAARAHERRAASLAR